MSSDRDKPSEGRDRKGRFVAGAKAGPGREAGRREHRDAMRRAITPADIEDVMKALLARALEGDVAAAALLLNRMLGKVREESPPLEVSLGDLANVEQVRDAVHQVVRLVADGHVSPDDGRRLVDLLTSAIEVSEIDEILQQHERPDPWRRN